MSLLGFLGISDAVAATAPTTAPHAGGFLTTGLMLVAIFAVFYFLLVRPQQKRAKEHRQLVDNMAVGDEIVTAGGIIGRIVKLRDNFVVVSIAKGVEMTLQKQSISQVLPKGTMDTI